MEKSAANTDLIRGHVITIILRSLQGNDKYGYEICREIEIKSEGSYVLKQPTLYSCLKRLESQGYITSYLGEISNGGRRRYYSLTEKGEKYLERDKQEWEFSRTLINRLLSDKDYDLTQPPPFNPSDLRPYTRKMNDASKNEGFVQEESQIEEKTIEETTVTTIETDNAADNNEIETITTSETEEEPIAEQVQEEPIVEETVQEEKPSKTSFSIFDLMPTAEDEEDEEEVNVNNEDEPVSFVVPLVQDTVDEDDLVAPVEDDEEESDASKIIAEAYDPYYGESYSEPVSTENAFSSLFDNNNSVNEFFGITEEENKEEEPEEEQPSGPIDLFAPIENATEQEEPVYEKEENYYVVPNREVSAYQSSQLSPKVAVEEVIEEIVEESITANNVAQTTNNDSDEKNYKTAFSKLFNTDETNAPSREVVAPKDVSEMRKTRDLPPAASMADLKKNYYAEGYNLKTYNRSNTEIYYNMNYMYSNKLNCVTCWVLYAIILLEIGLTFLFDSGRVLSTAFFIATPLIALIVPGIPTVFMIRNPQKRIKAEFDLNKSLINSSLLALNLAIIIAAIGFVCGVPLNDFTQITVYIILPVIYTLNLPIGILVYYCLFNSKKFHLS